MPPITKQLTLRTMSQDELSLAIDWAAQEGWNPGLHDATPFWAADPGGYLIGLLDEEPVAIISAVRYGDHFGFIGCYIVKPGFRGKGYGLAIWQAAIQHLQGRTIGLDGVVAQQDNYQRSGFVFAHRNIRYAAVAQAGEPSPADVPDRVTPLEKIPQDLLSTYDRSFFPEPRTDFLQAWVSQPGTIALGVSNETKLTGYGVLRPCRDGFKIGPLFADSAALAEALFTRLRQHIPSGTPYYLDVPASNPAALALAAHHGMKPVFETARMYLGPAPDLSLDKTYGITCFEVG